MVSRLVAGWTPAASGGLGYVSGPRRVQELHFLRMSRASWRVGLGWNCQLVVLLTLEFVFTRSIVGEEPLWLSHAREDR